MLLQLTPVGPIASCGDTAILYLTDRIEENEQAGEAVMPEQQLENLTTTGEALPDCSRKISEIIAMTEKLSLAEGRNKTIIPYLTISRNSHKTPLIPSVLTPSFCLILQGKKRLYLGQDILEYHPGDYLVSMINLPAFAQISGASSQTPYMGLRIDFTTQEIASVVTEAEISIKPKNRKLNTAAFIGKSDEDLLDLFLRLLKLTGKPKEAAYVSALIKHEMIFNLLSGDYGYLFFQQVLFDQKSDGVGQAIEWINQNYTRSFTARELAEAYNMSVSGLHHKFKAITAMGPLQYQKQLRLQEARRLMLSGSMDATTAALEVGYESPSQFSREYRRLFGLPPLKDIQAVRKGYATGEF
jgi:AraC-like DNA-binding protein